jgi:hypothetical protein
MKNAPFKFRPTDYYGFFGTHGWRATQTCYIAEEAERLGRAAPLPVMLKLWIKFTGLFASHEKRTAFRKFLGYVLFEPT